MDIKQKQIAYSLLTIKTISEDKREITGIATTPESDRAGDIVESDGAEYKLPIPLLWQHDSSQPIGEVYDAKTTKNGIEIKARLVKVDAPSQLAGRLEEAWTSIRTGLVKGLSIGFKPLEYAFMDDGGIRFIKWAWYELSAVTIPANASASITSIKSIDNNLRAALGQKKDKVDAVNPPASDMATKQVKLTKQKDNKMNIEEQLKSYQAERAAKAARQVEIMTKSSEAGATLDEAESEEYDTLKAEIKSIDEHLVRLEDMKSNQKLTVVDNKIDSTKKAVDARSARIVIKDNLPAGIGMARVVKCLGIAKGNLPHAAEIASKMYQDDNRIQLVLKDAVAAGSTSNAGWAGNLVGSETNVYADFIEYLRPQTILGKFGTNGIPSLRNVPFRVPLIGETAGGEGYWVGEGAAKPLTSTAFSRTTLEPLKVANIAVITEELLRSSSPAADVLVRDMLVNALKARLDTDFIDPNKVSDSGVSPASITNAVVPVTSTGNTADDVRCDIKALYEKFIAANNAPTSGVFIMSSITALSLSLMNNALGQREFPDITMNGGFLNGLPVITSEYVTNTIDTSGQYVVLVNAQDIYLGDEGGFAVDISREASLEMTGPSTTMMSMGGEGNAPVATQTVSLWQTNSVGFRAERIISWKKRRVSAVAVLDGVNWGACGS